MYGPEVPRYDPRNVDSFVEENVRRRMNKSEIQINEPQINEPARANIRSHLERVHKDFDYLRDRVSVLIEKIGPALDEQREQTPVPEVPKPEVTSLVASSLSSLDSQIMSLAYQVEYVTAQVDL